MIALLRGRVARQGDGQAVIDVNGVGYLVHASARTLSRLPGGSEVVELLVETQVRDDSIVLFGFADDGERAWFRLLLTVQGVGSRVALSLLGALGPDALATAVMAQDKAALSRAPGIGSRLAGRIVAELKDRMGDIPAGPGVAPRAVAEADDRRPGGRRAPCPPEAGLRSERGGPRARAREDEAGRAGDGGGARP